MKETRVTGPSLCIVDADGAVTPMTMDAAPSDRWAVKRFVPPAPDRPAAAPAQRPPGPQGAFAPQQQQPARPNPFLQPPKPQGPRTGGGSPYGRVGRR